MDIKKNISIGVLLGALGIFTIDKAMFEMNNSTYLLAAVQMFVLTFVAWLAGVKLAKTVNLTVVTMKIDRKKLMTTALIGIVLALIMLLTNIFVFGSELAFDAKMGFNLIVSSGIIEEVWLRLGLLSLFTLAFWKLFFKGNIVPGKVYYIAVGFTALLLFALQLPAVQQMWGLNFMTILQCVVFYALPPAVFGWIYVKHGFMYSVLSHVIMLVAGNFIFIPILAMLS